MAKKRKNLQLTAEDRSRFAETMRRARERIAERERIEAQLDADTKRAAADSR